MFPLSNQKRQIHNREERLARPVISPGIERQLPHALPLPHNRVPLLLCMLSDHLLDGRLAGRFRFPHHDAAIVVGCRDEGGSGRGAAGECRYYAGCGTAGGGVKDVAGYGVFGCHRGRGLRGENMGGE